MARPPRRALADLARLGERLRELRSRAGLSQMQLARAIGFNPTHGYKYVLRLEKGLVPNPTLRTIAGVLDAVHATWRDLAEVLPEVEGASPAPPPAVVILPQTPPPPATPTIPTQRGSRPLREWLRQQRRDDQHQRSRRRWQAVAEAEDRVDGLVTSRPAARGRRREYVAFARTVFSAIDAVTSPRPQLVDSALTQAVQAGVTRGLDRELLLRIQAICREAAGR